MRRYLSLTVLLGFFMFGLNAQVIFVKQEGAGNGTSWQDATGNLNAALRQVRPGDSVWVAQGIYFPTTSNDRRISFVIPNGVKVYGGFSGAETSFAQRNSKKYKTVLSGDIGSRSISSDNSYSVVYIEYADQTTVLDGFIITDGVADGSGSAGDRDRCGAGMYVNGSGKGNSATPRITNCVFQNNYARDGGAVYLNGRGGQCNAIFSNCEFQSNKVDLDGGAVLNDGRQHGEASPTFLNCIFNRNQGNYGGAICNYGGRGECSPNIQSCVFRNNEAFLRGGAIFNMDVEGKVAPVVNACQFIDNQAITGSGIYTFSSGEGKPIRTGLLMN